MKKLSILFLIMIYSLSPLAMIRASLLTATQASTAKIPWGGDSSSPLQNSIPDAENDIEIDSSYEELLVFKALDPLAGGFTDSDCSFVSADCHLQRGRLSLGRLFKPPKV